MRVTTIIVLAAAGLAAAQTSVAGLPSQTTPATSSVTEESGCGSAVDAIISSCLNTENTQLAACEATDWDCMCTQITNVVQCYTNCPSDPNGFTAQQRQTSYCNAAKQYGSKASSALTSATATITSAAQTGLVVAAATTAPASTASSSSAQSPTQTPNAMSHLAAPAGGALAALLGVVAFL